MFLRIAPSIDEQGIVTIFSRLAYQLGVFLMQKIRMSNKKKEVLIIIDDIVIGFGMNILAFGGFED